MFILENHQFKTFTKSIFAKYNVYTNMVHMHIMMHYVHYTNVLRSQQITRTVKI